MPFIPAAIGAAGAIYGGIKGVQAVTDATADHDPGAAARAATAANENKKDDDFSYGGDNGVNSQTVDNPNYNPNLPGVAGNPSHIQVNGPNGAQQAETRYQDLGQGYANQAAPTTDYTQADQARGSQADALTRMQDAANGNAPSQAAIMMKQGNDQAMANSLSLAAGARGQAAMAGAQQQAMGTNSAMATNSANNIGALRAQEMAQARGAYMQGATGMRGQDQTQAQYLSTLAEQQRQLGLQGQLGFEGMGQNTAQAELNARMAKEGASAAFIAAQNANDNANKDRTEKYVGTTLQAAGQVGAAAVSDARAKKDIRDEGALSKMRGR